MFDINLYFNMIGIYKLTSGMCKILYIKNSRKMKQWYMENLRYVINNGLQSAYILNKLKTETITYLLQTLFDYSNPHIKIQL
jgi:hypothetical protein